MHHPVQRPGYHPSPHHQHQGHEARNLEQGTDQRRDQGACPRPCIGVVDDGGECGQQDQRQDHHQILDNQPADRDAAPPRLDQIGAL